MPDLRPYQIEDIAFLSKQMTAGCFNEQRTGKTPTALKTFEAKGITKMIIICPASAVIQWQEEYEKWLGQPCIALIGTRSKKEKLLKQWTHGLIIAYSTFKSSSTSKGFIDEVLAHKPEGIIIDEAHRIKNPKAAVTKAILKTKNIPHRLALTGTPAQGKAYEVFCILHWLQPNVFSSYWKFIEEYFITKMVSAQGRLFKDIGDFKPQKQRHLQNFLNTIATQRKRKEVMPWLPNKDYIKIKLEPTKEQTRFLKELLKYFETEHIVTQGIIDRLIRYRQICLHPALLQLPLHGGSPKLEWVKQYLADYPEKSVLIFSKFTSFLEILKKEIGCELISGKVPIPERNRLKTEFQKGTFKVLALNIDAGKEALTLDVAETIIFTDKYPPIGDILQAEDRFIATSEDKANKPHTIIELMMKGTYDEAIYRLLQERYAETDLINDYKKYLKEER